MRFDSYHPAINLFFFAAVIAGTVLFNHPVFLGLSFFCSFAYAVKLRGGGRPGLAWRWCPVFCSLRCSMRDIPTLA